MKKKLFLLLSPQFMLLVALTATVGSLYFGEILKYPPCTLCWYQRICMYPLVFVLASGLWFEDKNVVRYTLPLSLIGWSIASYHVLLYYGFIAESLAPCAQGVSCTSKQIEYGGFITIPLMSWFAFTLINLLSILRLTTKDQSHE